MEIAQCATKWGAVPGLASRYGSPWYERCNGCAQIIMRAAPTIVTVPGFSGAPWNLGRLKELSGYRSQTMRLPNTPRDIDEYADFVAGRVCNLRSFVLMGDSFGAVAALALACRQPRGLRALVVSGGLVLSPTGHPALKRLYALAKWAPGPLYRHIVLRVHATILESPYDGRGEVAWTRADTYRLLKENVPRSAYLSRLKAAFQTDFRERLDRVDVPTLLLTPSHDRIARRRDMRVLLNRIPTAEQVVLPQSGEALPLAHPTQYAAAVRDFLARHLESDRATVLSFPDGHDRARVRRPN
jgi:pimeloyl-ACP methyl ester carboxylesterase